MAHDTRRTLKIIVRTYLYNVHVKLTKWTRFAPILKELKEVDIAYRNE